MNSPTPHDWLHHLEDEADAAYLYSVLADAEDRPERKKVYAGLAAVEERHVAIWQKLLREAGHEVPVHSPSAKARFQGWLGKRLGPDFLLPLLLEEEGKEVKGYLDLHKNGGAVTSGAALTLAKESAEHAQSLAGLAGRSSEPWHKTGAGGFLRNVVYGFNDGLTANFGLVAGMIGAQASLQTGASHAVLVAGVAGTVANALSMGSSGYLAAMSEREVYEHEIAMEREEIRLMPEVEEEELALIYQAKGIPEADAKRLAAEVMRDPERALAEKVRDELGIGEASATPMREATVTGVATAFGSLIPVLPFLFGTGIAAIWTSFAIAMLSHFGVGAMRSVFTGRGIIRSGMDMFLVGLGVAGIGYFVGEWIVKLL